LSKINNAYNAFSGVYNSIFFKMAPPETMYCAQQINIPPELPDILKQFTKAAIRTQPQDVLAWSAA